MATMTGLEDHITIIDGRMYEPGKNENDAYEVIGTEYSLKSSRLTLGSTYELTNIFRITRKLLQVTKDEMTLNSSKQNLSSITTLMTK